MSVFVDTNVLVYVRDSSDPEKQRRAAEWIGALWETGHGRLSHQVLHEYYVTLTNKLDPPRELEEARADVLSLLSWRPVAPDRHLTERAWAIQDNHGFSWWDSLIVAAAIIAGSQFLLTEDLSSGQMVESLEIISPFDVTPESVLPRLTRPRAGG